MTDVPSTGFSGISPVVREYPSQIVLVIGIKGSLVPLAQEGDSARLTRNPLVPTAE